MSYPYTHTTRSDGTILDFSIYNGDHIDHVTHQEPTSIDDYSATVTQMQLHTNPAPAGVPSLASSVAGELERLRFAIGAMIGDDWYKVAIGFQATAARISLHGAQVVSPTISAVLFDTVDHDTTAGVMVDLPAAGLKAPVTGFYRMGFQVMAGDPFLNTGEVKLVKATLKIFGGATIAGVQEESAVVSVKGLTRTVFTHLTAGDIVQLVVFSDTAGILFVGTGYFPAMWMSLVGT